MTVVMLLLDALTEAAAIAAFKAFALATRMLITLLLVLLFKFEAVELLEVLKFDALAAPAPANAMGTRAAGIKLTLGPVALPLAVLRAEEVVLEEVVLELVPLELEPDDEPEPLELELEVEPELDPPELDPDEEPELEPDALPKPSGIGMITVPLFKVPKEPVDTVPPTVTFEALIYV